jgi:hypothetical protein
MKTSDPIKKLYPRYSTPPVHELSDMYRIQCTIAYRNTYRPVLPLARNDRHCQW